MNIKNLVRLIKSDMKNHGGIGFIKSLSVYFFDARFRLLLNYRIGRYLILNNIRLIPQFYKYKQITKRSCQISYHSNIGELVKFIHPIGIVIGDNVIIGDKVKIWQNVTIGSHGKTGLNLKYPIIKNEVKIYAGAKVIGGITLGFNSIVGANSVVLKTISENSIVAGVPARLIQNK